MKYKSKLKRNSKYNPHSERFRKHLVFDSTSYKKTCEDKIAYLTINKAKKAKRQIEKDGSFMEIYKCPNCKHYHLTAIERN